MRWIVILIFITFLSCDKVIEVDLPAYERELVVEMYLEQGHPLRCLLLESLPYTDTAINKPVNDAIVIFSDGFKNDTLKYEMNQDRLTGRYYNYYHPKRMEVDTTKTYSLTVIGDNKKLISRTRFTQKVTRIDSLIVRESKNEADSFSVGLSFADPGEKANYYRVLIGKDFSFFRSDPTDFRTNDISFNGKPFSYFSEANYTKNDTVRVRIYSLTKEHYEYLESIGNARRSNFNPFSQPSRIKSNVAGGLGIFTSILYEESKVIIK